MFQIVGHTQWALETDYSLFSWFCLIFPTTLTRAVPQPSECPNHPGQRDPNEIPRFPIAIVDDIPMMLIAGYSLEGMPSRMEDVLEFFRTNGHFRSRPLVPSDDPLAALTHLMTSAQWIYADSRLAESGGISFGDADNSEREKSMLMEQLLRLIDSVYRLPHGRVWQPVAMRGTARTQTWQKIRADVAALKIKWNSQEKMFAFQNGTHLPMLDTKIHQRKIWPLTGMGYEDAELVLERRSDDWVDVMVTLSEKTGANLKPGTLILFSADVKSTTVVSLHLYKYVRYRRW